MKRRRDDIKTRENKKKKRKKIAPAEKERDEIKLGGGEQLPSLACLSPSSGGLICLLWDRVQKLQSKPIRWEREHT